MSRLAPQRSRDTDHLPSSLPVVRPRGFRPRRPAPWRTATLIAVHLVMIAHVAQWLLHGVTLSPVEPSEGMELARHGIINTGLVFFVVAIAVTAVFGRFFCGWGCHLIALQDASRWLLRKLGFAPRPLRSRVLGLVPLVAFGYMFLWPAIYKAAAGEPFGPVRAGFLITDFWATFPGLAVAVVTFVVCGFVIVFVLGSKGYCTYGCPYGAAFGMADRVAPIRVRVTDACQGCATCTSVCTSNVRVHEEVRDHRMVVDPGCMKCLDCVANCPNDALFVGAGPPAIGRAAGEGGSGRLSRSEEVLAGIVWVVAFFAYRGLYGAVPFLLSLGLAAIVAGLAVVAWRLIRNPEVRLGPIRLKSDARLGTPGRVFAATVMLVLGLSIHSLVLQVLERRSRAMVAATAGLRHAALDLDLDPVPAGAEDRRLVVDARRAAELADRWSPIERADRNIDLAWLAMLDGDRAEAERRIDAELGMDSGNADAHLLAARLLVSGNRWQEAARAYARVVELDPSNPAGHLGLGVVLGRTGRIGEALEVFRRGLEEVPGSTDLRYNIGLCLALTGDLDAATRELEAVLSVDPGHLPARENLAGVLAAGGRFAEAAAAYDEAVNRSPDDPQLRIMAARALLAAGEPDRAAEHIEAAIRLDPSLEEARRLLE